MILSLYTHTHTHTHTHTPGLPRFFATLSLLCIVHKPKNKNGGGLGTRLSKDVSLEIKGMHPLVDSSCRVKASTVVTWPLVWRCWYMHQQSIYVVATYRGREESHTFVPTAVHWKNLPTHLQSQHCHWVHKNSASIERSGNRFTTLLTLFDPVSQSLQHALPFNSHFLWC